MGARTPIAARLACLVMAGASLLTPACAAASRAAPAPPARMVAEWEPALGTLIRWPLGIPMSLVIELAEDDTLYTLVEGSGAENQAHSTFSANGVNMDHVRFIQTNVYSMWTRDWGPQCVFGADGRMGIADPWFDGYPWVPGCESSRLHHGIAPAGGTSGAHDRRQGERARTSRAVSPQTTTG